MSEQISRRGQEINELLLAFEYDGELLTWEQLYDLLEVPADGDHMADFVNACLGVQQNPKVLALPLRERLQAIRSAFDAVDYLVS